VRSRISMRLGWHSIASIELRHRRRKRLGAAHAAETRRQDPLAREAAAVMTRPTSTKVS
jgi:hypothetical protein